MKDQFGLKGKWIWVIGGAGYLGVAVMKRLTELGAKVICADLESKAFKLGEEHGFADKMVPETLDIGNESALMEFIATQIKKHGPPDGLVNLAYASTVKKMEDLSGEEFDAVNHSGLTANFILGKEMGKAMATHGGGSVVFFGSMYGMVVPDPKLYDAPMNPNPIEYGVGKAGIIQMTKYLAMYYGLQNVRFNCISPGPFPNLEVKKKHPEFIAKLEKKTFLQRTGDASEVSGPVAFLLSDISSFITGHNLVVDGGWTGW
ncbi:SDR family oxidoreductase [Cyclobacterium plantarum]|uniref:SDR family oxidoreductase n=1 Tax=Cyclobacterium plantarum TaxID=2716263 RepID=A0ABX0HFB4_9BACT|nr:SDR family oxidoreductase [Cyclobacterium plantarum]NHE58867.1 SDR family oxidoreductase [Cyclobacterium plantarum]